MGPLVHCWVAEQYFGKEVFDKNQDRIILGSTMPDIIGYFAHPPSIKKGFKITHIPLNIKKFPKYFAEAYNLHLELDRYMHKNYIYKLQLYQTEGLGDSLSHEMCECTFDLLLNTRNNIFYEFPNIRKEKGIMQSLEDRFGKVIILEKVGEVLGRWNKDFTDFIMRVLIELSYAHKHLMTKSQIQRYVNHYAGLLESAKRCSEFTGEELDYMGMIKSFPPIKK